MIPLPRLNGPVDAYAYSQAVPLAYAFDFQPRPVFQSYMAYTPRLARMNAEVLLGEHAPEWILFPVMTIDRRLPTLDDAPSWPLLLTHYQLAGAPGGIPLLRRSATPLPWHFEPLRRFETETGQFVHVPSAADGLIWARIDVHETRRDALVGALLSSPTPYIGIAWSDGHITIYRLVSSLASDGFLLSPLVESSADFVRLVTKPLRDLGAQEPVAITVLMGQSPGADDAPRGFSVEFLRLHIGD